MKKTKPIQQDTMKFDSRRKELTRTIIDVNELKLGEKVAGRYDIRNVQVYDEEGIKHVVGELKQQKLQQQKILSQVNATLDATKHLDESDELKQFRKMFQQMQQLQGRHKALEQRDMAINNLEECNKQLTQIKDVVGEHIKL